MYVHTSHYITVHVLYVHYLQLYMYAHVHLHVRYMYEYITCKLTLRKPLKRPRPVLRNLPVRRRRR